MNQDEFRKLISGQKTGAAAAIARALLSLAAVFYGLAVRMRNFLYSRGLVKAHRAKSAVISVGNITAGGTGKTPLVVWLCRLMEQKNISCAILTRGYKSNQGERGYADEPAIFIKDCPKAQLIVNPDRTAGASEALERFGVKVLVMDDGFQHRRLARDIDIVTIDATEPFGYGRMLPAGLLREPVCSLSRADAVVMTRCDQVDETRLAEIEKEVRQANAMIVIARSAHCASDVRGLQERQIGLEEIRDKNAFAFCGIGNPAAFLNTLRSAGSKIAGAKIYDDHHQYSDEDIAEIYEEARAAGAEMILTTEKDWTKAEILIAGAEEAVFAYVAVELKFVSGEEKIRELIEGVLGGKIDENAL